MRHEEGSLSFGLEGGPRQANLSGWSCAESSRVRRAGSVVLRCHNFDLDLP